ncbi:toxin-antitoxin system HicB family antitoxin [Microbacterium sp. MPKO10]|uniref:toxin-antitoxin system HicB family antitoxin n=1 Tax=Microbacterium sp. MPKO10 TaxID=2989818 RepID=UPI002235505F|nr:toxin-antitoxin system HicB family antitoxin [Microbacterium sp. MPKO10]MCW4456983.1 toxin-antitoxin system HicB family antitoxin [Microbacterium sp. MPKO10]
MQIGPYVETLQQQLSVAAAGGSESTREAASLLAASLEPASRLALMEALSEAAGAVTAELAPGSVDVRLRGRDVEFVVSLPEDTDARAPHDGAGHDAADESDVSTSRTTVRIPDSLKTRAEEAAAAQGISLNSWLVRAIASSLQPQRGSETRSSSLTGWVR